MKVRFIEEPELEFGGGAHIDIRHGLAHLGPLDAGTSSAPTAPRIALIGSSSTAEGMREWLERCRQGVPAKQTRLRHLFPAFPGFRADSSFRSELSLATSMERRLQNSALQELARMETDDAARRAVELFSDEIDSVLESDRPDVVVVCVPPELIELRHRQSKEYESSRGNKHPLDFHDLLKATGLARWGSPLQLVVPSTYGGKMPGRKTQASRAPRTVQDEATRAWNLHTALYYKAGGRPWRLKRTASKLAACYVGISFPMSVGGDARFTSLAQVFDERGDGMIIRGGKVKVTREDRIPHLDEGAAEALLESALSSYYGAHKQYPARLVVHKSSRHTEAELRGFRSAMRAHGIQIGDFLSFGLLSDVRLFRSGKYPPLRGTFIELDESTCALYSRGSVDFYRTYPGNYVPNPLAFRIDDAESTARELAEELLALSKMNWNDTQFDHRDPVTLAAANGIGKILKHAQGTQLASRYAYYM